MPTGTIWFIGQRLAEAREARGITNGAMAELIGVSPTAISQYEKGAAAGLEKGKKCSLALASEQRAA